MSADQKSWTEEIGNADLLEPDRAAIEQFVSGLRMLGDRRTPEPSPELLLLLGVPTGSRRARSRRLRHAVAGSTAALVVVVGMSGVAAAKDELPGPAQRVVSTVIDDFTPFHVPRGPLPSPHVVVPRPPVPARVPESSPTPEHGRTSVDPTERGDSAGEDSSEGD